jgi:hypothetical protein
MLMLDKKNSVRVLLTALLTKKELAVPRLFIQEKTIQASRRGALNELS